MGEFRITFMLVGLGSSVGIRSALAGALVELAPESRAVVDGPLDGAYSNVTLSLETSDALAAAGRAAQLLRSAAFRADVGRPSLRIVDVRAELVTDELQVCT